MKKFVHILSVISTATLLVGISLPAAAQGRGSFTLYDRDDNGMVTQQEFNQVRAQRRGAGRNALSFAQMDADKNGAISRSEFASAHQNRLRPGQRRGAMLGQGQGRGMGRGAAADAPRPQLGMGSGQGPGMGRGMNRPDFSDVDANRDGSITQDELNRYRAQRLEQRAAEGRRMRNAGKTQPFTDLDTNKDGKIDASEFSNHQIQQPLVRNR